MRTSGSRGSPEENVRGTEKERLEQVSNYLVFCFERCLNGGGGGPRSEKLKT